MWWKHSGARELRQIIMGEWDPIGVRGDPYAAGEYDAYLGQIASRLREGATNEEIATFLDGVEEYMGLEASGAARARNQEIAARLHAWYAVAAQSE